MERVVVKIVKSGNRFNAIDRRGKKYTSEISTNTRKKAFINNAALEQRVNKSGKTYWKSVPISIFDSSNPSDEILFIYEKISEEKCLHVGRPSQGFSTVFIFEMPTNIPEKQFIFLKAQLSKNKLYSIISYSLLWSEILHDIKDIGKAYLFLPLAFLFSVGLNFETGRVVSAMLFIFLIVFNFLPSVLSIIKYIFKKNRYSLQLKKIIMSSDTYKEFALSYKGIK